MGKARKSDNGYGEGLSIHFDPSDDAERRAQEMSKLLASKHGRRKASIVALLDALSQYHAATGEVLSPSEIYTRILGSTPATSSTPAPQPKQLALEDAPPPAPSKAKRSGVKIEKPDAKTRAEQIAAATVSSGAGWFD